MGKMARPGRKSVQRTKPGCLPGVGTWTGLLLGGLAGGGLHSLEHRQGEALGKGPSLWSTGDLGKLGDYVSGFRGMVELLKHLVVRRCCQTSPRLWLQHRTRCRYDPSVVSLRTQLWICFLFLSCTHQPAVCTAVSLSLGPPRRLPRPCPRPAVSSTLPVGTHSSGCGRGPLGSQGGSHPRRRPVQAGLPSGQSPQSGAGRRPISCFTDKGWHFAQRCEDLVARYKEARGILVPAAYLSPVLERVSDAAVQGATKRLEVCLSLRDLQEGAGVPWEPPRELKAGASSMCGKTTRPGPPLQQRVRGREP